jgi:hypothetical protein
MTYNGDFQDARRTGARTDRTGETAEPINETLRERLSVSARNAEEQQYLKDFVISQCIGLGEQSSAHPAPVPLRPGARELHATRPVRSEGIACHRCATFC